MITIYGIPNCDTIKKSLKWLDQAGIDHQFVDVRKTPLSTATIGSWIEQMGWQAIVNKRSTTWKELSKERQDSISDELAIELIGQHPTLFKRPVVTDNNKVIAVGFKAAQFEQLFSHA